ncbi:MAG: bifunctional adenosylcobinamide kinase/adenosylcobinamide-phosphate guanylyltransferase [Chloroflexi bacterium]|jgi:adenosylcobinamide kinase/adenosylcobinamide-phosphate guanylyltransferase|nr:bifunctional adenosylcobinamide kinase/adenosylcobinamide-phosphate guanylyltransferase [Chloroflexota bacterium]
MGTIHLITGGVKSGKSSYAVRLANDLAGDNPVRFIATAHRGIGDESLDRRIDRHIEERPSHWTLFEPPTEIVESVTKPGDEVATVLDCVTLWIGDLMTAPDYDQATGTSYEVIRLIKSLQSSERSTLVITNEVGSGIAPPTVIGNDYADELGTANRLIANAADQVTLLVAGQALRIK